MFRAIKRRGKDMECPECKEQMNQLCMYGIDDNMNIDLYCEKCGTFATISWKPGKRARTKETME
jgi:uncharacterized Zn finger protein